MQWIWCSSLEDESLTAPLHLQYITLGRPNMHNLPQRWIQKKFPWCSAYNETDQSWYTSCFQPVLLLVSHLGPEHDWGSWQIQAPLSGCIRASAQRESTRDKTAGCSSKGTHLPAAGQTVRPCLLEAITCGCLLLTQLSRVQVACSFCSFQLQVVYEATLGRGTLKQLFLVYNTWVITHATEQRLLSCLDNFVATNRKKPARGASEKKSNFGAVIHCSKGHLSPLTTREIKETKYST